MARGLSNAIRNQAYLAARDLTRIARLEFARRAFRGKLIRPPKQRGELRRASYTENLSIPSWRD